MSEKLYRLVAVALSISLYVFLFCIVYMPIDANFPDGSKDIYFDYFPSRYEIIFTKIGSFFWDIGVRNFNISTVIHRVTSIIWIFMTFKYRFLLSKNLKRIIERLVKKF